MQTTYPNAARSVLSIVLLAAGHLTFASSAGAQPTPAQQSAIQQSCRNDFLANCSGVPRGGAPALNCLQQNSAKLSAACRQAVSAITPPAQPEKPAAATAAPSTSATVSPPPPAAAPTPPAATAVAKPAPVPAPAAASATPAAPATAAAPPPPAAAPTPPAATAIAKPAPAAKPAAAASSAATTAAPAAAPTAEQQAAIKRSCQRDFMTNCSGVQPGGPEALACLQRNAARLSPGCQTSLAAIAAPAAAASAPAVAATPAPAAARPLPPGITPAGRIIRRAIERNQ